MFFPMHTTPDSNPAQTTVERVAVLYALASEAEPLIETN